MLEEWYNTMMAGLSKDVFTGDSFIISKCLKPKLNEAVISCYQKLGFLSPHCHFAGPDGMTATATLNYSTQQWVDDFDGLGPIFFDVNEEHHAALAAFSNAHAADTDWSAWRDPAVVAWLQGATGTFKLKDKWRYIDADCNAVDPGGKPLCGSATIDFYLSPISLLWDTNELDRQAALTAFPIKPGAPGKWFSWHASAKAPLLVYDPSHTGRINSAQQLFGNWTFGGQRSASLNSAGELPLPWRDGFEALATLDRDADGKLSGDELEALGLWFDRNRDGGSQPGEVKTVAESGVTIIYYTADRRDDAGNIWASVGYERIQNGRLIRGSAVDWFAEAYESEWQGLQELSRKRTCSNDVNGVETAFSEAAANTASGAGSRPIASDPATDPTGMWLWNSVNDHGRARQAGILKLRRLNEKFFVGKSVVQIPVKGPNTSGESVLAAYPLLGFTKKNSRGETQLLMFVFDGQWVTMNRAVLKGGGKALRAKSSTGLVQDQEAQIAPRFEYEWQALRLSMEG